MSRSRACSWPASCPASCRRWSSSAASPSAACSTPGSPRRCMRSTAARRSGRRRRMSGRCRCSSSARSAASSAARSRAPRAAGPSTPTEAGPIGAATACAIAGLRRSLNKDSLRKALVDTAEGTSAIFIIVVGAAIFSRYMSYSQLPTAMSQWLLGSLDSQLTMVLAIAVIYLILGCVLESVSIMLLTMPLLVLLLTQINFHLLYLPILLLKLLEIGLCTPPVGMNVYVVKSALGDRVPLGTIFRGVAWFIAADLSTLGLLIAFPQISLWLPDLLSK